MEHKEKCYGNHGKKRGSNRDVNGDYAWPEEYLETKEKLKLFYQPFNEKLEQLIGQEFQW